MKILIVLLLLCVFGCRKPDNAVVAKTPSTTVAKKGKPDANPQKMKPQYLIDSLTIAGKTYTVVQGMPWSGYWQDLRILYKRDTIYRHDSMASDTLEIVDFDKDGLLDILMHHNANTPGIAELIKFDAKARRFKEVRDFDQYPAAVKIEGTKYYYSYHRSGCADENWGSELFYIEDFSAVAIGEIEGKGCENEKRNGIFIYRLNGEERTEIKAITRKPGYYKDKWEFIDKYWRSSYKKFK